MRERFYQEVTQRLNAILLFCCQGEMLLELALPSFLETRVRLKKEHSRVVKQLDRRRSIVFCGFSQLNLKSRKINNFLAFFAEVLSDEGPLFRVSLYLLINFCFLFLISYCLRLRIRVLIRKQVLLGFVTLLLEESL